MSFQPLSHRILFAAQTGETNLLRKLFKNRIKTDAEDEYGNSALNLAVVNNETVAARMLLEYGCDVNHQNGLLLTPIHQAVMNDNKDTVLVLLEYGAKLNLPNHEGYTPLQLSHAGSEIYRLLHLALQGLLGERYFEVADVPVIPAYSIPVVKVKSDNSKKGKKGKGKKKKKK